MLYCQSTAQKCDNLVYVVELALGEILHQISVVFSKVEDLMFSYACSYRKSYLQPLDVKPHA